MENAIAPAKEAADVVTLSNKEDGVAGYLKEHILKQCMNRRKGGVL